MGDVQLHTCWLAMPGHPNAEPKEAASGSVEMRRSQSPPVYASNPPDPDPVGTGNHTVGADKVIEVTVPTRFGGVGIVLVLVDYEFGRHPDHPLTSMSTFAQLRDHVVLCAMKQCNLALSSMQGPILIAGEPQLDSTLLSTIKGDLYRPYRYQRARIACLKDSKFGEKLPVLAVVLYIGSLLAWGALSLEYCDTKVQDCGIAAAMLP